LILPARSSSKTSIGIDLLPDTALVCSCNSVTKGAICAAIAEGWQFLWVLEKRDQGSDGLRRLWAAWRSKILDAELKKARLR